jgi:rhodanese-related sulfurtransferase
MHMPDYPNEGALRGGHIPGAKNVPWARAANPDDGTFKPAGELKAIYLEEQGLNPNDEVIAYCRIGERSSHTWFVLTNLLGFKNVRNYDGSWTEWGTWWSADREGLSHRASAASCVRGHATPACGDGAPSSVSASAIIASPRRWRECARGVRRIRRPRSPTAITRCPSRRTDDLAAVRRRG